MLSFFWRGQKEARLFKGGVKPPDVSFFLGGGEATWKGIPGLDPVILSDYRLLYHLVIWILRVFCLFVILILGGWAPRT